MSTILNFECECGAIMRDYKASDDHAELCTPKRRRDFDELRDILLQHVSPANHHIQIDEDTFSITIRPGRTLRSDFDHIVEMTSSHRDPFRLYAAHPDAEEEPPALPVEQSSSQPHVCESTYRLIVEDPSLLFDAKRLRLQTKARMQLLNQMSLGQYTQYLKRELEDIKPVLEATDNHNRLSSIFSPLEGRLLRFEGFQTQDYDVEEVQELSELFQAFVARSKGEVFGETRFVEHFLNQNLSFFDMHHIIRCAAKGRNIVAINRQFGFYRLELARDGVRYWKQDCRAEKLKIALEETVLVYAISFFRKLHYDVYSDNHIHTRPLHTQVVEFDLTQILNTCKLLATPLSLWTTITQTLSEQLYVPTHNDRFDVIEDNRKSHAHFLNSSCELDCSKLHQLFDNPPIEVDAYLVG